MDQEQKNQQEPEQENVVDLPEKKPRTIKVQTTIGIHEEIKRLAALAGTTQSIIAESLIEQGLLASVNAALAMKAVQDKEAKEKKTSDIMVVNK